jgi:membrane protease YdiL (CAAX protease family)
MATPTRKEERTIDEQYTGAAQEPPDEVGPRAPVPPPWTPSAGTAAPPYPQPPAPEWAPSAPSMPSTAGPGAPGTAATHPRPCSWTWKHCVAGLLVGFGPEALLTLTALGVKGSADTAVKVTVASALTLLVGSLIAYGWQTLAAWLFSLRMTGFRLALWGFTRPPKAILWTVPTGLAAVYGVSLLYGLAVNSKQQEILSEFPRSAGGLVLFLLVAVVMAPLFEEIFFRGFLFRGFADSWGWVAGAVVSAAIFGLAHLQLDVFVPLFALGFALAWVYKRTGSLWTSIALHALFNLLSVLAWWLLQSG